MKLSFTLAVAVYACVAAPLSAAEPKATKQRPNIVIIVADDLGYGELGCYGGKGIPTPHIDSIAAGGVRFTSGYVSCPVCSPTRAGLMTGRYQQRFGHEFNPGPPTAVSDDFGLVKEEATLAERLRSAGYSTGMVGKWHLGYRDGFQPTDRGFQEYFGFLGGANPYRPNRRARESTILRGKEPVSETEYLTDAFGREAVAFIDRHHTEPFFLYLTFNAVHAPLQAADKYRERFAKVENEKRQTFSAMLSALDDAVGAVLAKLRKSGLEENTLLFFISDNGGPTPQTTSRNDPLRGTKGTIWEGGIRIPFIVQWKGHLPAGKTDDRPVIALDIHSTALAAADIEPPSDKKLDGVNFLPFLNGTQAGVPHDALFWRYGGQMAIRMGDWKLMKSDGRRAARGGTEKATDLSSAQLFNLREDIAEAKDVAADQPDKVKQLASAWEQWNSTLSAPRWNRAQRANPAAKAKAKSAD